MISTCNQSAPWPIVREHSSPSLAKSAERMDGAMMAAGAMVGGQLRGLYKKPTA
jgi:hypothetical protein